MNEPLRVTHVVLSLDMGGLERVVVDLVRTGRLVGNEPSVLCIEKPGAMAEMLQDEGTTVLSVDKGPGFKLRAARRAAELLRRLRPDVVHTHQLGALLWVGRAARRAGRPVVVHTEHGKHYSDSWRRRMLARLAMRRADHVFTVSQDIASQGLELRVFPPERTSTVLNGIDVDRFAALPDTHALRRSIGLNDGEPVVGTVARLSPVKDQATLLEAFAMARKSIPSLALVLVGDGPSRSELETRVGELALDGSVHFAGMQQDVVPWLGMMDLFVLSSRSEGVPLAALEAMASGLPVMSTDVGGMSEVVEHGRTGVLVPVGNPEWLAQEMVELLGDRTRLLSLGRSAREDVRRRFSLQRMAGDYEREYRRLLAQRSAP